MQGNFPALISGEILKKRSPLFITCLTKLQQQVVEKRKALDDICTILTSKNNSNE